MAANNGFNDQIGILSFASYLPDDRITGKEIARLSGLPAEVVEEKMGIKEKTVPGPDDHTVQMGVWAAERAIAKANIETEEIDLIIYTGEEHKEYPLWTAGIYLQKKLGAVNAWAFDVSLRCSTTVMAMHVAKSLMQADKEINTVLLAGGYRNGDFINYENPRTRFMYNLAAGGGAIILKKNHEENILLETEVITDGSFSEDVYVPAGGTKQPLTGELLESGAYQLDVLDPEGMKQRLEQKSMDNFLEVIRQSLAKSGFSESDLDYLAILHMKRSAHNHVLKSLGLKEDQAAYLNTTGHAGQFDQIISLENAEERGLLQDGMVISMVSAGIGYAWSANTIRWGRSK
ncbi:3-oxoacyl-ACP synthase [Evansella clarkii]|uniref:3-oxoacyl-ACP synthase n=1 Tax=Evansella clarkii TaxID=79879 RepID=UPI001F23ED91|nr:3-oxoacyl-ACP synthase [Evansella clarkii]